jgi:hypothetical protein
MQVRRIGAWFRREDYDAFKKLSPDEYNLPDTFDEWEEIAVNQVVQIEAAGGIVEKVILDPQEFALWCKASGVEPNGPSRAAFAVYKEARQNKGIA